MAGGAQNGEHPKVSASTMTINLITAGLGAGVLSMPWGVAGASIISALVINFFVLALNALTILMLVIAGEKYSQFHLGGLLREIPGKLGVFCHYFCNVFIWIIDIMCLVGYMIVIADALQPLIPESSFFHPRWIQMLGTSVLILPVCFLDQKYLAYTSWLSVGMNIYMFILMIVYLSVDGPATDYCLFGIGEGSVTYFSAMMFTVILQMCILPMYEHLEDRTPVRMGKLLALSFSILFVLFCAFATFGYMRYGPEVASNVQLNFPATVSGNIARVGMLFVVLGVYPMMLIPCIAPVEKWEQKNHPQLFGRGSDSEVGEVQYKELGVEHHTSCGTRLCRKVLRPTNFVTLILMSFVTVISCFITDLGFMNVINGASSVVAFVGVIPGLVGLYLMDFESKIWRGCMYGLMVFGLAMSIMGLIFTDNNADQTIKDCLWLYQK